MATRPVLHMICGKIASGKSSLASQLAEREGTVRLSEDHWLDGLYGDEMSSIQDFVRCSAKLRRVVGPHVVALLDEGVSVVLDFEANTLKSRNWMREILDQTDALHVLHVLDVPDEICLQRLHARNAAGEHPFSASEEQFYQINRYFQLPAPDEGFHVEWYRD